MSDLTIPFAMLGTFLMLSGAVIGILAIQSDDAVFVVNIGLVIAASGLAITPVGAIMNLIQERQKTSMKKVFK